MKGLSAIAAEIEEKNQACPPLCQKKVPAFELTVRRAQRKITHFILETLKVDRIGD